MEISILSNFLFFIWIEIFPNMFNQNGNLNTSVSFLLRENNTDCACVKPTLNRYFVPHNLFLLKLCLNNYFSNLVFLEAQYLATNSIVVTEG